MIRDSVYNVKDIFELDNIEFYKFLQNLNLLPTNNMDEDIYKKFSMSSLNNLLFYLQSYGLSKEEIKQIITKSPNILFKLEDLNNLFLIYKNDKFKGYINLNNQNYETYMLDNNYSKIVNDNTVLELMIDSLYRNDYRKILHDNNKCLDYYKSIKDNEICSFEDYKKYMNDIFKLLEKDYSKKNYYIKKRNKLI